MTKEDIIMAKRTHLSLSERTTIQSMLHQQASFKAIARQLNRNCSTISKEIRAHLLFQQTGCHGRAFNDCALRYDCSLSHLCQKPGCTTKYCRFCSQCHRHCKDYQKELCPKLDSPPYVCNGCPDRNRCTLEKRLYSPSFAQKEYEALRSESRSGLSLSHAEAQQLDALISPLLRKGQSVHHICVTQPDSVMFSEKTIYNYLDAGLFEAKNLDLPRKVRFRPRKSRHASFKVDKACRLQRTYQDFQRFLSQHPGEPVVELDSVEGKQGGKVLLTIHFVSCSFMLAFLRDRNTAASVTEVFSQLFATLGKERFSKLFPILLADNGSEFSDPLALELDPDGNQRTRVFYCDPSAPYQKGAAENNHTLIRRILPKGTSFDDLTQQQVTRMMNHINSYARKKLGEKSPYECFRYFYGQEPLDAFGAVLLPPEDILLRPE